jgi:hypothetical protein
VAVRALAQRQRALSFTLQRFQVNHALLLPGTEASSAYWFDVFQGGHNDALENQPPWGARSPPDRSIGGLCPFDFDYRGFPVFRRKPDSPCHYKLHRAEPKRSVVRSLVFNS